LFLASRPSHSFMMFNPGVFNAYPFVGAQATATPTEIGASEEAEPELSESPASASEPKVVDTNLDGEGADERGAGGERDRVRFHEAFIDQTQYFFS
jgi:hypothetical protein